jgi:tRNA(fMet)-specific endonuclease VapC
VTAQYLLDTDTCIDLLRGVRAVVRNVSAIPPDACAVSSVTAYELLTGALKCRSPETECRKVQALLDAVHQLTFDTIAAERTASVRAELERRGEMIGPYDVLLAGQSLAAGLTLATSNAREFGRVRGLQTTDWRAARAPSP